MQGPALERETAAPVPRREQRFKRLLPGIAGWSQREFHMAKKVRELMGKQPVKLQSSAPVTEAARQMRSADVGAIIVEENSKPCGIVTDRDIAIRVVAQGLDPQNTPVSQICSKDLTTLKPDDDIDRAVQMMRQKAIRRVLVVDAQDKALGIVSLGDLALERDSQSVLGQISAAPPNQ
jgi:CBS domain-containing protein